MSPTATLFAIALFVMTMTDSQMLADQVAPSAKPLTNADILAMVKAQLSDDVILNAVERAETTTFEVSPAALIELKNGGVSNRIINMMQKVHEAQRRLLPRPSQGVGTGATVVGTGAAAPCRIFITEDEPASRSYVMVRKEIQAGKKWYGSHDENLMRELAEKAERVGADAIIKFHEWRAPSMFSWAAAKAGGMAVKWTEEGKAEVSKLKGQCWESAKR